MGKKSHREEFRDVFSKNYLRALNLFWSNPELFFPEIDKIRRKFNIPDLPPIEPAKNRKDYDKLLGIGQKTLNAFLEKNKSESPWIFGKLREIRKNLKLGREWNKTLLTYAISGIIFPPPFSVFIDTDEESNIIVFEINKDTTKADLDLAWGNTKKDRERMFGKARSSYPSKTTIKNFNKFTEALTTKHEKTLGEDNTGGNTIRKYKTKDSDIIGKLFPDENDITEESDQKRVNKLRVNKSRFKKI